jgi:RNA polymerase sigma-70 factor, ECF subfamily
MSCSAEIEPDSGGWSMPTGLQTGCTDWLPLRTLYQGLLKITPTIGARVAYAAVVAETDGPCASLTELAALVRGSAETYQFFWAVEGALSEAVGNGQESRGRRTQKAHAV